MKNSKSKTKTIIILTTLIICIGLVIADLLLYYTSLQQTGIPRGFSRYWDSNE